MIIAFVIWLIGWMFVDGFLDDGANFILWPLELGEHFKKERNRG